MSVGLSCESLYKHVALAEHTLQLLEDINLTLTARESLAIVGASGSGKSTLLGLMAGLDTPSSGRVFIDHHDLSAMDEEKRAALRASTLSFIFQSFQLLPSLTALQNVMLPLELQGTPKAKHAAQTWLEQVGLAQRLNHFPKQLSGGEQQRVAIARAFVTQPKLLFADEPTGNLDGKTGRSISNLLFELNQQQGTTLILVTHDPTLAQRCHHQITLDQGKIIERSSPC